MHQFWWSHDLRPFGIERVQSRRCAFCCLNICVDIAIGLRRAFVRGGSNALELIKAGDKFQARVDPDLNEKDHSPFHRCLLRNGRFLGVAEGFLSDG